MSASSFFPQDGNSKRLLIAFAVTTLFMVAEAIGGWLSGSLALLADAGHMLTDSAALFIALRQYISHGGSRILAIPLVICVLPRWPLLLTPQLYY